MQHLKTTKKILFAALGMTLTFGPGTMNNASATTADYYKCSDRVGGEYNYGRAPSACNANSFGDDSVLTGTYNKVIFFDASTRTSERIRYIDEMNAIIRDSATYYIKKRKPTVTAAEINAWVFAMQTTASAESYWSQYRKSATDSKYKLMRGDYGHGHGMMQIDDRSHYAVINNGTAWNLITGLTYAMDLFYTSWQAAPAQSCVGSATNYKARIRAAWAAYNGGSSKICRWTNTNDTYAANDTNFLYHYNNRMWEKYMSNANKAASIDVACLMENKENCSAPAQSGTFPVANTLYKSTAGLYCVVNASKAYCVSESRDAICLNAIAKFSNTTTVAVTDAALAAYAPATQDRQALCRQYDKTLIPVGANAEFVKAINIRSTAAGGLLGTVPKGQSLTVLDFELRTAGTNDRYYKVKYGTLTGYVYGGTAADYATWMIADSTSASSSSLAKIGESVKVLNSAGINLRTTAAGTLLSLIPVGAELQVLDVVVQGNESKVYYKVTYQGQTGYIYTGFLSPSDTTAVWTQVVR